MYWVYLVSHQNPTAHKRRDIEDPVTWNLLWYSIVFFHFSTSFFVTFFKPGTAMGHSTERNAAPPQVASRGTYSLVMTLFNKFEFLIRLPLNSSILSRKKLPSKLFPNLRRITFVAPPPDLLDQAVVR